MKKWYYSKTLWVNAIAVIGFAAQKFYGSDIIDPQAQAIMLAVVNFILRMITKHELS